jgi:glycosyltransferase involved in cell wall biosynthesis
MSQKKIKVICLSFHTPPILRPQSILFGKMIPEWVRQGAKPIIASYETPQKWQIGVPIHYVSQKKSEGNILKRNFSQYRYYQEEAKKLSDFAKRNGAEIIFSFANPQESNIIGALASKKTGLPFVSHFSDPYVDNPYSTFKGLNLIKARYLERLVVKQSKKIIFTNQVALDLVMKKYSQKDRRKASVIPHCFDEKDYPENISKDTEKFVISYIGAFYKERNPELLLKALKRITENSPELKDKFEIFFVGGENSYAGFGKEKIEEAIKNNNLEGKVHLILPVKYKASLKLMKKSDCLIAIDADFLNSPFLPSKLIDYAGARRYIIGITPSNSPTEKFLSGLGFPSFNYNEKENLANHLKKLISGEILIKIKEEELKKYEVKQTTAELLKIFTEVINEK